MRYIFLFLFLNIIHACSNAHQQETATPGNQEGESVTEFSTRLNPRLMFTGNICEGTESVWYREQQYFCEKGQWLVVVDNVNSCNTEAECTEVAVEPTIMKLHQNINTHFELLPVSPLRKDQRYWVKRVWVIFFADGGVVLWR
jgi:hypothetical protein